MMREDVEQTWLDQAINWLSPKWGFRRTQFRTARNIALSYEAGRTDRRASGWITSDTSANAEIGPWLARMRQRSRDLVRNNAYATNALDELAGACVGTGILAQCKISSGNAALAKKIMEAWKIWVDECDADRQLDFYGLQDLIIRGVIEGGEMLIRRRLRMPEDGYRIPLQIQVMEPDHLDTGKTQETKTGRIVQGVEFDATGRRVAYWLFPAHPGDISAGYSVRRMESTRIPAEYVLHVYRKKRQQVRGVPWLAPVIMTMRDEDEYTEAELVRKKIEACFATFITQAEGPDTLSVGSTERNDEGQLEETVEPGMIKYLKPGEDIKFGVPSGTGAGYRDFKRDIQTKMAVGISLTYEQMTGDLSNVNYSSYRAGLISFRTKMDQFRWLCFVPMFCRPVSQWFADIAYAAGEVPTRDFRMEWQMPKYGSVSPSEDAKATLSELRMGTKTWPQAVAENGYDPDEQIAEIAEANRKLDSAGIVLDCDPRSRTASGGSLSQKQGERDENP